jgi:hypothetical protein
MGKASIDGQTVLFMMASGLMAVGMEKALIDVNTVIFMMVSGQTVKSMERANSLLQTKSHSKAFGRWTPLKRKL